MSTQAQKRIFIIGPMTTGQTDPKGLEWEKHIENIAEALRLAISALRTKNGDRIGHYEILQPPNNTGNIRRDVFPHLLHCDLAVADISNKSPNVIYEIAILHANGTPVILIDLTETIKNKDTIFYLNQDKVLGVDTFDINDICKALLYKSLTNNNDNRTMGQLESAILGAGNSTPWNPITEHLGGVALVNVAAAAGVATGQHYNFLKWVLEDGGIFSDPNAHVDRIILLRPDRIQQVDEIKKELIQRFGKDSTDREGKVTRDLPGYFYNVKGHPRGGYFFYRVGRYIVDYPTPISSLSVSRQYIEMREYVNVNANGEEEANLRRFEQKIIDVYFSTLKKLATSTHNTCDWDRAIIRSLPEAIELLAAEKPDGEDTPA